MLYQHTIEMRIVFTHYTFIDISLLIFVFIISFFFFFLFVFFLFFFFFFQAEDGIRDGTVTGVQTCALPISVSLVVIALLIFWEAVHRLREPEAVQSTPMIAVAVIAIVMNTIISLWLHEIGRASCRERV